MCLNKHKIENTADSDERQADDRDINSDQFGLDHFTQNDEFRKTQRRHRHYER